MIAVARVGVVVVGVLLSAGPLRAQGEAAGEVDAGTPTPTPTGSSTETTTTTSSTDGGMAAAAAEEVDEAQVAALLADHSGETSEPVVKLYGFADFSFGGWSRTPGQWNGILNDKMSFYVGKLNVYIDTDIAADWKSMVEVRFMFLPNGSDVLLSNNTGGGIPPALSDPLANPGRYQVAAADYSDVGRVVPWGGINIERAYLEHTFSSHLRLRAGRFLTPWGIWNVDHGSPVIIGPIRPYVIGEQFFPEAQTGFELLGSTDVGENATLGYHLTLSNGRGPVEQYQDLDSNKAIGARVYLRGYWLGDLTFGASGYGGTVTDRRRQIDVTTQQVRWFNFEHARELSLAADVRWLLGGLHLQAEVAVHQKVWDDAARPVVANFNNTVVGTQPDVRRVGFYFLAGYRLPWLNLMPYFLYTYYDTDQKTILVGSDRVQEFAGGLNVRIKPRVVLKAEWGRALFFNPLTGSPNVDSIDLLHFQLAWVF